jgi:hypothetical protein
MLWFDYHRIPFSQFHQDEAVRSALQNPHAARRDFWALVPVGRYSPHSGRELVSQYLISVEERIAEVLRSKSIAYCLHVCRRLQPHAIEGDSRVATIALIRATLEAAIQKYATPEICSKIARSDNIHPKRILGGLLYSDADLWRIFGQSFKKPQLVLTEFGPSELADFYRLEKLAYEIWKGSAALRALGKGAQLVVASEPPYFGHDTSDEFQSLMEIYDQRQALHDVSSTGTVFPSLKDQEGARGTVFLPGYNAGQIPWELWKDGLAKAFKVDLDSFGMSERIPNFIWHPFNLLSFYSAHEPFADAFRQQHGFKLVSAIAVLAALAYRNVHRWITEPGIVVRYWLRAYDGPDDLSHRLALIRDSLPTALELVPLGIRAEDVEIEAAVQFFTHKPGSAGAIDLVVAGPHSIFLPAADGSIFTDYAWIQQRLYRLFYGLALPDQNFKGDSLERLVRGTQSALPVKACRALDGTKKQIDAAFDLGNLLLLVECKVKAISIAWERGTPEAVDERRIFVEKALMEADEKAIWLANHALGFNYDIRKFEWVLAVAVTPFAEFVWSTSNFYWLTSKLPRIMTPSELKQALDDGELKTIGPHHQMTTKVQQAASNHPDVSRL